jgi:hypothetical protein
MSDTLSRITAHFDSLGVREIAIPEWDLTIYCTPISVAERTRIYKGQRDDNDYETVVNILLVKAKDKDGKPIFTIADKATLLQKADSGVVIRVAAEIMAGGAPKAAELKN